MILPKRGDRFEHRRFLDLDSPPAQRVPARCAVTATKAWGPGETDRTVYFTYAKVWDAGEHHGAYRFELARVSESVLRWLPAGQNEAMTETDDQAQEPEVCQYSAAHKMAGVPATTTVETATVGTVPCCAHCAAFYERMGGQR